MTKQELIELADDLLDSNEEPAWEVNLGDCYAAVFTDITAEGGCLVVYQDNLTGEIDNAEMFDTAEEAESHLNAAQQGAFENENDWV
jgi:hypothetical protein